MGTHNFFSNGGVEAEGIWCRVYQLSPRSGDEVRKVPVGIQVYAPCAPWRTGSSYSPFFQHTPSSSLRSSTTLCSPRLTSTTTLAPTTTSAPPAVSTSVSRMAVVDPGDSDILESIPSEA